MLNFEFEISIRQLWRACICYLFVCMISQISFDQQISLSFVNSFSVEFSSASFAPLI